MTFYINFLSEFSKTVVFMFSYALFISLFLLFGFVDSNFKKDMTKDECVEFVLKSESWSNYSLTKNCKTNVSCFFLALALAMNRDGSSGGVVRLGIITEDGIERRTVLGNELPRFYED